MLGWGCFTFWPEVGSVELGTKGMEPSSRPRLLLHREDHVQEGFISFSYIVSSRAPFWFVLDLFFSQHNFPLAIIFNFLLRVAIYYFIFPEISPIVN